jgi:uncharacterized membrane protein
MIVMAALIYLPVKVVGAAGLALIVLHNLVDGVRVPPEIAFAGTPAPDLSQILWLILHQPGVIPLFGGTSSMFVAYPLIPWVGVMAVGSAAGTIYTWDPTERRKWLYAAGASVTAAFILLRLTNVYGDQALWSTQDSPAYTILSFINTTKYPPSLLFLLMTIGPGLLILAATDGISGKAIWQRVAITFGRVPMFFYLLQMFVAHGFGVVLSYFAGKDVGYLFVNFPANAAMAPPDHGFSLWVTYAAWVAGLMLLYPLCLYYGEFKRRNRHWLLSYL